MEEEKFDEQFFLKEKIRKSEASLTTISDSITNIKNRIDQLNKEMTKAEKNIVKPKVIELGEGKNVLITGGAGFIGSHLVDRLIKNNKVIVLDNLVSGKEEFIQEHANNPNFEFHKVDLLNDNIDNYFKNIDEVWHLAANPDIRAALKDTRIDVEQNILVTYKVLEAMRKNNVNNIFFTSTSTIYGEAKQMPTPENYSPLVPISLYGSTKLACESLISSYCHTFGIRAIIFRFANIIGERSTHGIIYDFINKLKNNPNELEILGDGTQCKSYLLINDCIDAMFFAKEKIKERFEVFNIGSEDKINVKRIAEIVCEEMGLKNVKFNFISGADGRGWKGDVKMMQLSIEKIKSLGWKPKFNSEEAVRECTKTLLRNI